MAVGVQQRITISGDLGSGKTTLSEWLSTNLGVPRRSTGEAQRLLATQRGLTTLALSELAEAEPDIDRQIDELSLELLKDPSPMVVDSRLAWHFLRDAFSVHLVTDPQVATNRVMQRGASPVEAYGSTRQAEHELDRRANSERRRFLDLYDVDIWRLRNYDLVIDTSDSTIEQTGTQVIGAATSQRPRRPTLLLSPRRVMPTEQVALRLSRDDAKRIVDSICENGFDDASPITVGYSRPAFYVVNGHVRLSGAIRAGLPFIPAELAAESSEHLIGGVTADSFLGEARPSWIYDWEDIHGVRFAQLPDPSAAGDPLSS